MSLINDALKKAQLERDNPPPAPVPMPGATAMARPGNPAKTPVFKAARWLIGGVIALSLIGTVVGFLIVTLDKPDPQPKAEPPREVDVPFAPVPLPADPAPDTPTKSRSAPSTSGKAKPTVTPPRIAFTGTAEPGPRATGQRTAPSPQPATPSPQPAETPGSQATKSDRTPIATDPAPSKPESATATVATTRPATTTAPAEPPIPEIEIVEPGAGPDPATSATASGDRAPAAATGPDETARHNESVEPTRTAAPARATAQPVLTGRPTPPPEAAPPPAGNVDIPPDPATLQFLRQARITGIMAAGNRGRVLMNNAVYRVGSVVWPTTNLRISQIFEHEVHFVDESGAQYRKQFQR